MPTPRPDQIPSDPPDRRRRAKKTPIETVGDLLAALAHYPADTAVRLAVQPGYPQATLIGGLACSPDDADQTGRDNPPLHERVVWVGEGRQLGYLPEIAREALGGPWTS